MNNLRFFLYLLLGVNVVYLSMVATKAQRLLGKFRPLYSAILVLNVQLISISMLYIGGIPLAITGISLFIVATVVGFKDSMRANLSIAPSKLKEYFVPALIMVLLLSIGRLLKIF